MGTETGSARTARRRKLAIIGGVVALCFGVLLTRVVWEGRSALDEGDRAVKAGDTREAIAQWRRAARWYAPLAPHVGDAYERLEILAKAAEKGGDIETATAAWRGIRGSIMATRSFYTPHSERLEPANRNIARLMAGQDKSGNAEKSVAERETWHYALLARDESPSLPWALLALLGFAMWIGGAFGFALRGVNERDELVARNAAIAGIAIAGGMVIWLLGLYNA